MRKFLFFSILMVGSIGLVNAQCMMREVSLQSRCNEATLIVEGNVTGQSCFWDAGHRNIFTRYSVNIYKTFKGDVNIKNIEVISLGGLVDDQMEQVSSSLSLNLSDAGVFMLKQSREEFPADFDLSIGRYDVVAAAQGFIKYNATGQSASDPFHSYTNIVNEVYQPIEQFTGKKYTVVNSGSVLGNDTRTRGGIVINGFTPTTVTAGTHTILSIHGSGFGSTKGSNDAYFIYASSGNNFIAALPTDYILWSDTLIKLYVGDFAGTGSVRVGDASNPVVSSGILTVNYARLNVNIQIDGSFQCNFIGPNSSGYKWIYNNQFNSIAKPAFLRAFNNWRCATLVNWQLDAVNTTTIGGSYMDGKNVITFDLDNALPTGVLGRCSSLYSACGNNIWYVKELDIVFSTSVDWNYSTSVPGSSQSDFESVALHELGHGQQLGHVVDNNDVMNWAISDGDYRRTLNQYNITCGTNVMTVSTANSYCSNPKMVAINASNCQLVNSVADVNQSDIIKLFPNPTKGTFTIETETLKGNTQCEIYNLVGELLFQKNLDSQSEIIPFNPSSGVYIVKLRNENGTTQKKLIVE